MKTLVDRFFDKVKVTSSCWLWTSATWGSGYGFFWIGGRARNEYAHRLAWILANKLDIPDGLVVMHSCDNKVCVNPEHLLLGTHGENQRDSSTKGRKAHGERNGGGGKLTESDVRRIKARDLSIRDASVYFGVSTRTVKSIRNGRIWRHVAIGL